MNDIEVIRKQAQKGDIQSQIDLAHAYMKGEGVVKNRAHYLNWLTKAAEQGCVEAQCELVEYHSNKKNKNADPTKALYWLQEAQKVGRDFTNEQLLKAGDPDACNEQIEIFLFGKENEINFEKAKELILRVKPSQETLLGYSKRYFEMYHDNAKKLSNISYLIKLSFNGDHNKLNEFAVGLTDNKAKNSMKIAFSLFVEAYSLGNSSAAGSYLYCLISGKGCRRDIDKAASVYYDCKRKNMDVSRAFSSETQLGHAIKLPNNFSWRMACLKQRIMGVQRGVMKILGRIPNLILVLFVFIRDLFKKKGVSPMVVSAMILLCIIKLNFPWCVCIQELMEGLVPVIWGGYIISFIILMTFFSFCSFFRMKRKSKLLREKWKVYGLCLPPFNVVDIEVIENVDGCYGPSTYTTVYKIRFIKNDNTGSNKNHCKIWHNPNYSLETVTINIAYLSEKEANVTVHCEYEP